MRNDRRALDLMWISCAFRAGSSKRTPCWDTIIFVFVKPFCCYFSPMATDRGLYALRRCDRIRGETLD